MAEDRLILVYTTLASPEQAEALGKALVREKLAACVNIFPGMKAIYQWRGALEQGQETAMIIKSRAARQKALLARAKELHPYETPALLVLPVESGAEAFAAWVREQTG